MRWVLSHPHLTNEKLRLGGGRLGRSRAEVQSQVFLTPKASLFNNCAASKASLLDQSKLMCCSSTQPRLPLHLQGCAVAGGSMRACPWPRVPLYLLLDGCPAVSQAGVVAGVGRGRGRGRWRRGGPVSSGVITSCQQLGVAQARASQPGVPGDGCQRCV